MSASDAGGLPKHFLEDGRAIYLSLQTISAYAAITLLGSSDTDLFGSTQRINLPILGVEMSSLTFLWIAPTVVVILNTFFHFLALNTWRSLPRTISDESFKKLALGTPIYLRWLFCKLRANGVLAGQYQVSTAATYTLPIASLAFFWWRSHVMHAPALATFIAFCLLSLPLSHLAVRMAVIDSRFGGLVAIFGTGVVASLLLGWLTYARTTDPDSEIFAQASLNHGAIITRPEDYVPRFVWVSDFIADKNLEAAESFERQAVEDQWFDRRQYALLNGVPHNLDHVDLRRARMNHTYLPGIYMRDAHLDEAILTRADMESIDASGTSFRMANLSGAHMEQAFLRGSNFDDAQMQQAKLEESFLSCANFSNAKLHDAAFDGAFLDKTLFINAELRRASLRGAYAKRADFRGADLEGADLTGAILWGADLSTARNLTPEQLASAIGDDQTRLPEGLEVPHCADVVPVQPLPYRQQWWLRIDWVKARIICPWTGRIELSRSANCQ